MSGSRPVSLRKNIVHTAEENEANIAFGINRTRKRDNPIRVATPIAPEKAEKNILSANGYSAKSNIPEILMQFKAELETATSELEKLKTNDFFDELKAEVEDKKSAMQVDGKTIADRVNEFARLNYLLSFKYNQSDADSCIIPLPENEVPPKKSRSKLKLLALALELELELLGYIA